MSFRKLRDKYSDCPEYCQADFGPYETAEEEWLSGV
jgi:hypothetical protein